MNTNAMNQDAENEADPCKARRKLECKQSRSMEDYMKERVKFKIDLYFCKAKRHQRRHYWFACIIAIGAVLVPVLINLRVNSNFDFVLLATVLSVIVSICVAIQEIFHFREHWRNYDLIDANLRNEEMLFSMSAGPYDKIESEILRNKLFVERIEELIKNERADTINMRTSGQLASQNQKLFESMMEDYLREKKLLTTQNPTKDENSGG